MKIHRIIHIPGDFPGGSDGKESACNAENVKFIPGLERSSGEGNGYPFQYSCLEKSMDRGVTKESQRKRHNKQLTLSLFTYTYLHICTGINADVRNIPCI